MPVRALSPELAEKARLELGEDPRKLEDGIAHLKEWVAKQPHLHARTDDQWLACFLRGCKFSVERAKKKIDLTYTLRTVAPELYTLKVNDPKFMEILKLGIMLVLPKMEKPDDPRVILLRSGHYPPEKYSIIEVLSVSRAIHSILIMEDDNFVVAGTVNVMDFENASLAHVGQMTPALMKKMVVVGQEAAPIRTKAFHYYNMPAAFGTFFNIAKSFLNEKSRSRIHVHGKDFGSVHKHISKDILPAEFGGNGGAIQEIIDYWVKKVEEYRSWLEEDAKYGTDESKRPGKPQSSEEMFGVDGSFRQLDFD